MVREGTKPDANIPSILGGAVRLRVVLGLASAALVVPAVMLYTASIPLRSAILLMGIPTIFGTALKGLASAYFQVEQEMKFIALMNLLGALILGLSLVVGVVLSGSVATLASAYGLAAVAAGVAGAYLMLRRVRPTRGAAVPLLRGLPAFTAAGFLGLLIPQLGPLVLPKVAPLAETGHYSAAFRIPGFLYALPSVVAVAFFPQLFAYGNQRSPLHTDLVTRELRVMSFLGLLMAIPVSLNATWVIRVLFGADWAARSGPALAVLSWIVAVQCVSIPLGDALTTQGLQSRRAGVMAVSASVGICLFWLLARRWGAVGGAWAALVLEVALAAGYLLANPARRTTVVRGLVPVGPKLVLGLGLCLVMRWAMGEGVLSGAAMGVAITGAGLALDRDLRAMAWRAIGAARVGLRHMRPR